MTASMGTASIQNYEDNVAQQIQNQINPPVLIEQAPWLNTTSTTTTTTTIIE